MKNFVILSFALATACGGREIFTWGDAVDILADSFCDALGECGYYATEAGVEGCVRHNILHLCELANSCDIEVDPSVEGLAMTCADDIAAGQVDCFFLTWGVVPGSCVEMLFEDPNSIF